MEAEKNDDIVMNLLNTKNGFLQNNNMKITEVRSGYAKVEMKIDDKLLNIHGLVHGGALFALADTAAGTASFTTGKKSVTLNASINFIKPGVNGTVYAIAEEISAGRTTGVYEVFIFDDEDNLLCRGTFTVYFIGKRKGSQ